MKKINKYLKRIIQESLSKEYNVYDHTRRYLGVIKLRIRPMINDEIHIIENDSTVGIFIGNVDKVELFGGNGIDSIVCSVNIDDRKL